MEKSIEDLLHRLSLELSRRGYGSEERTLKSRVVDRELNKASPRWRSSMIFNPVPHRVTKIYFEISGMAYCPHTSNFSFGLTVYGIRKNKKIGEMNLISSLMSLTSGKGSWQLFRLLSREIEPLPERSPYGLTVDIIQGNGLVLIHELNLVGM